MACQAAVTLWHFLSLSEALPQPMAAREKGLLLQV